MTLESDENRTFSTLLERDLSILRVFQIVPASCERSLRESENVSFVIKSDPAVGPVCRRDFELEKVLSYSSDILKLPRARN